MNDSRCLSRLESARVGTTMVAPVVVSFAHARRSITHRGSIVTSVRLHNSSPLKRHWPWPALNIRKRAPLAPRRPRNLIGFAAISKRPSASVTTSRKSCKLVTVPCIPRRSSSQQATTTTSGIGAPVRASTTRAFHGPSDSSDGWGRAPAPAASDTTTSATATASGSRRRPPIDDRSAFQIFREPPGAALPGVVGVRLVVGRAVVRVEAVAGLGIDHDLDVLVAVLLEHLAELLRVLGLRVLVLGAVEAEERDLDVLGEIEAGHRPARGLIRPRGRAVPRHGSLDVGIGRGLLVHGRVG